MKECEDIMVMYSIIMPVYNVEEYLERSIQSIISQTIDNWELLIVNDGSTDNSGMICEKYAEQDDRITVTHQKNAGSGRARAVALDKAKGDYICFVDPDDYLSKNALAENTDIVKTSQPDIIVNAYYEVQKEKNGNLSINKFENQIIGEFNKTSFKNNFSSFDKVGSRSLWNKVYNRKFLKDNNIEFTDQRVGQDALFNYTAYKHINSIIINKEAYYHYDVSRDGSAVKQYRSRRAEYEKNIADTYTRLIESWDLKEKYTVDILLSYWNVIFVELRNLSSKKNKFTNQIKNEKIHKLTEITEINQAVRKLNYKEMKNIFHKILLFCIKNAKYSWANWFMKIRVSSK